MKTCNTCNVEKPLTEFHKNKVSADGHANLCKPCKNARDAAKRREDPARNERRRAKRASDPEAARASERQDYAENKDRKLANRAANRAADPEKYREYQRRSLEKNPDQRIASDAAWDAKRREQRAQAAFDRAGQKLMAIQRKRPK